MSPPVSRAICFRMMLSRGVGPAGRILLLAAVAAVFPQLARAQTARPTDPHAPFVREPEYPGAEKIPSDLFDKDARRAVVLPSDPIDYGEDETQRSTGVIAKLAPEGHRLPEGYVVANRRGHVQKNGAWNEAVLDVVEGLPSSPPLRILPNSRLSLLEEILAAGGKDRSFSLTGRVTEFQGNNYLLLENVSEARGPAIRTVVPPTPKAPATQTSPGREPTAEEVVRQLMENRPRRELVIPQTQPAAVPGRQGEQPGESIVVDQVGRVMPTDQWWTFSFEDPTPSAAKPKPMRILPNQLLEVAISLSAGGTNGAVLVISGEITRYQGNNYMLLRKVLVKRDMGNLH
jgi:hypothetical protein